ncbi:MAG: polyphosphate kinase 2 family protein [Methylovirgula sp.]|jgi:PPK2 family polyphosphate:nucleotide phosphotransferase
MDFQKEFLVKPDSKIKLADIDPASHGSYTEADANAELAKHKETISVLQRRLNAEATRALLIVLQGIDSAGKDGTIWHVINSMDPEGVRVTGFKVPTAEELAHDFLWRVDEHAPAKGNIAVFNRSHYEDVLVARVHSLVPKKIWNARYDFINEWEKLLVVDNNTTILKFFLYISKEEQLRRFKHRLDDPERQWKISEADYKEREYWDDYIDAFEDMFSNCSKNNAPWFIIPSNDKWFRNLAVAKIIAETLEEMNPKYPPPKVNIDEIRQLYHSAVKNGGENSDTNEKSAKKKHQ